VLSTPDKPLEISDLEGLYHVTVDSRKLFIPYFDLEWDAACEEAYPWLSIDGIKEDMRIAMYHMFGASFADEDFVVCEASGVSKGTYKHSYHILIRPQSDNPVLMSKHQLRELVELCLKPKYHVKDPRNPSKGTHIIDPAPFGANFDFRMVHQSKPGGERPLKPITHLDKPAEFFMLEHIPPGAKQLQSRIPTVNPPALPAQLLGDPEAAFISSEKSATPPAGGSANSYSESDRTQEEIVSSKRLSFLTDAGKLWLANKVLAKAGIQDVSPTNVEAGGSVYCRTNKGGRSCPCIEGERHQSNNVKLCFRRTGKVKYKCLAPGCSKHWVTIGHWPDHLRDQGALIKHTPALLDLNAVDYAMRAMTQDAAVTDYPSYDAMKTVFELANFKVTSPHCVFVRVVDTEGNPVCNPLDFNKTKELQETMRGVKHGHVVVSTDKEGNATTSLSMKSFVNEWLDDPEHRLYQRLDFLPPPLKCPNGVYNLFDGFEAEKWGVDGAEGNTWGWEVLLDLATNHDKEAARIIEIWAADIFQRPGVSSESIWSSSSYSKGTGKDTMFKLLSEMLGAKYCTSTSCPSEELFGAHSLGLMNKVLVHVNETADLLKHEDRVKDLVTNPTLEINPKNLKQFKVRNTARLGLTANEAGRVRSNDRRVFTTHWSVEKAGDTVFWGEFYAWKGNKCNLKAVFDRLRTLDISKVTNMQALVRSHVTTAAEEASMASADVLTQWIVQNVEDYIKARDDAPCAEALPPAISTHTSDKLFADFEEWGLKRRLWNSSEKPQYHFYKFSALLNERYGKKGGEAAALEKVGNIGPSKKNGYRISWEAWHQELIRHKFMTAAGGGQVAAEDVGSSDSEGDSLDFTSPTVIYEMKDL
jgi:hypothetical protein